MNTKCVLRPNWNPDTFHVWIKRPDGEWFRNDFGSIENMICLHIHVTTFNRHGVERLDVGHFGKNARMGNRPAHGKFLTDASVRRAVKRMADKQNMVIVGWGENKPADYKYLSHIRTPEGWIKPPHNRGDELITA